MNIIQENSLKNQSKPLFKGFMDDYSNQTKDIHQKFKCTT